MRSLSIPVAGLALGCLAVLAGCGSGDPTPEQPPAPAPLTDGQAGGWSDGITLTTLWTLGDLPPAKDSVVIAVEPDGRLTADGEEHTLESLGALLAERAQPTRGDAASSRLNAVLAIDEGVPWRVTAWTLQACAGAHVNRVFFAVRTHGDDTPGAFAAFLPLDAGLSGVVMRAPDLPKVEVRVVPGDEAVRDPFRLLVPLGELAAKHARLTAHVDADGDCATGSVLTVMDVVGQAGAPRLTLQASHPARERDVRAEVEAAKTRTRASGVELVGHELPGPAPSPPPGRRVSGYAGFTSSSALTIEEEKPEEELIEDGEGR